MNVYFEISSELNSWYFASDFSKLGFKTCFISVDDARKKMSLKDMKNYNEIKIALDALQ